MLWLSLNEESLETNANLEEGPSGLYPRYQEMFSDANTEVDFSSRPIKLVLATGSQKNGIRAGICEVPLYVNEAPN